MVRSVLFFICAAAFPIDVLATPSSQIQAEYEFSIRALKNNIFSNGAIVASPSKSRPNYYYEWIRDSAIALSALLKTKEGITFDSNIDSIVENWVNHQLGLQVTPKLEGLGEPRFYLDGRANNEPWGRPQNDGPALRALTAFDIASRWMKQGRGQEVQKYLYRAEMPATTLIKRDLEYVSHHWNELSFDLWEEEKALHFFTLVIQRRALEKGALFALSLNDPLASHFYKSQADAISETLKSFIDTDDGSIQYAIDRAKQNKHPNGTLDISIPLAANLTFDSGFQVPLEPLQRTVDLLIEKFFYEYPVNQKLGFARGIALGRYPGDIYDGAEFSGGNPWFLSTLALAEYDCLKNGYSTPLATAQFNRVLLHADKDGSLSEQFHRITGFEQGARDLTWSYAAFLTAYHACFLKK